MNSRKVKPDTSGILAGGRPLSDAEWDKAQAARRGEIFAQIGATINVLAPHFGSMLDAYAGHIYTAMEGNGFWSGPGQDNFASKAALLHSEVTELLEANRNNIEADDKIPEFTGEEAEAADIIIRLLDMAGRYNWRLGEAVSAKMLHNLSRPYKHGKAY